MVPALSFLVVVACEHLLPMVAGVKSGREGWAYEYIFIFLYSHSDEVGEGGYYG